MDAKHGAKSVDNGRLKFCLQSFASFSVANRYISIFLKYHGVLNLSFSYIKTNRLNKEFLCIDPYSTLKSPVAWHMLFLTV